MTIQKQIEELRAEIAKHDRLYDQNRPIISDAEYDELYYRLLTLERKHPEYYSPNSPTQKIYTTIVSNLEKVQHPSPMLSQEKVTTEEGLLKFAQKADSAIIVQEKLDGLTVVVTYENGVLKDAVTRGNGIVGERVLHTVRTIRSLPPQIAFKDRLIVRGEVYIPYAEFERINVDGEYSNTRNLAGGTVRQLDSSIAASRGLDIQFFEVVEITDKTFRGDYDRLMFLESLGLPVVKTEVFQNTAAGRQKLLLFCKEYADKRQHLDYAIDGLVLKFENLAVREQLGETSKAPRWAIAYKFKSPEATTKLTDIVWQVGRTGQITPVAVFDEVDIDNVKITRASLHNIENIRNKDIRIGDTIVVSRRNDVIPQVEQSIKELRPADAQEILPLQNCPECSQPVHQEGPLTFCIGADCKPQLVERIIHFAKRDAMNVDGLGRAIVEQFVECGFIKNVADLYTLAKYREEILKLEGFGTKKVDKLFAAIENSKTQPLSNLLFGLSVQHCGKSVSRLLAQHYGTMEALMQATSAELSEIEGVGPIMADAIAEFFALPANQQLIAQLKALGLNMTESKTEAAGEALKGKTFVITGTLSRDRKSFKAVIESYGGKVTNSVSKKTDFLLMGEDAEGTSKHQKAVSLNVPIISEKDLMTMIE